jgi:2-polyprenyl-3-methyl-5-hydroxy-6-metoxy-1,4-benzoquinol methylase
MEAAPKVASEYADRMYSQYARVRPNHPSPSSLASLLSGSEVVFRKSFSPWLPASKNAKMLDLGCGYGEFVYFLQREGYAGAMGVDRSAQEVEVARKLGVANLHCVEAHEFLRGSLNEFDFISAIDVLEHIPKSEIPEFLDLVRAALRPGGRFLCQVPNLAASYNPLFYMDFSHETPFTPSSLKQILELTDFAHVQVFPMGPVVHGAKSAVRCVIWKAISAVLRFVQTVEGGPRDPLHSIFTAAIFATAEKG